MKFSLYFIISVFIFSSCFNDKTKSVAAITDGDFKQSFVPVIKGSWLMTDYMTDIEKTKSPLKSADKLKDIVELITDGKVTNDSLEVNFSFNNHEGDGFFVTKSPGQTPNSFKIDFQDNEVPTNFYELGYELINKDTCAFLYHYDKANKLLDKKEFCRSVYNPTDLNRAGGLQYFVNDKLFAGNYNCTDDKNQQTKVQFTPEGKVIGLTDATTYFIFTDFNGGSLPKFDEMMFETDKTSKNYGFQISGNTINIYETTGDEDDLQLGKLKYKFVKN